MSKITFANKVDITSSSVANINKLSASDVNEIKNVVNANDDTLTTLNNSTIYSNNEVVVGTYKNKPLYRKIINCGALPNNTTKNVNHNIANIEYIRDFYGMATDGTYFIKLGRPHITLANVIGLETSKTQIILFDSYNYSNYSAEVTLEYTKTTD